MTSIKSAIWSLIIIGLLSCSNGNDKMARYVAPVVVDEATNFEVDQAKSQTNERR